MKIVKFKIKFPISNIQFSFSNIADNNLFAFYSSSFEMPRAIILDFKYNAAIQMDLIFMFRLNWIIGDKLAGSRYPDPSDLPDIYSQGIRAIVSLEHYDSPESITQCRMEHLNMAIPDFTAPSLSQLKRIIGFISAMIDKYKPVLVHCYAGIGRTGTILAAYLIHTGSDVDSALAKIRSRIPGAVQTADQEHILHVYAQDMCSMRI